METAGEFFSYVTMNGDCMEWKGGSDRKGYGCLKWKEKNMRAHRLAYELTYGEIPKGYLVCHSCDNPPCINPRHLWAATAKQNSKDMMEKGRSNFKKGIRFPHAPFRPHCKLTENQVREIYSRIMKGETLRSISKIYGVKETTIGDINRGKIWSSLDNDSDRMKRSIIVLANRGNRKKENSNEK